MWKDSSRRFVFRKSPLVMKATSLFRSTSVRRSLPFVVATVIAVCFSSAGFAQQHLSKRYQTGKNVRIELRNISGTIVVESWNKDEIRLSATIESPSNRQRSAFKAQRPISIPQTAALLAM